MLAAGIFFVVLGHCYQPQYLFYPPFSFHMPLFFFISGYFFRPPHTIEEKFLFIKKKTLKQLIPYYLLNFLFGAVTMSLKPLGINLGDDIGWNSFFRTPFLRADQFLLFIPAWFLINLYFINVIAGLVYSRNKYLNGVILMTTLMLLYPMLKLGLGNWFDSWKISGIRIFLGFFFVSSGYVFKLIEPSIKKYVLKPAVLVILFAIINILNTNFGVITYNLLFANIVNELVWVPVVSTFCIILMIYVLSHYLNSFLDKKSWVYVLGDHTYSIMVWHYSAFWVLNVVLYAAGIVSFSDLSKQEYKFNVEKLWMVYMFVGLAVPLFLSSSYQYAKKRAPGVISLP